MVSRVVPESKLEETTEAITKSICSSSRAVSAIGKKCLYQQLEMTRDEAYQLASDTMLENVKLQDSQEGINAFVEKRKPKWTNTDNLD